MATYAWSIDQLSTKDITRDGTTYTDVIIRVQATLTGTSENIGSITATSGFDIDLNNDDLSNFTAYNDVTEANVSGWIEDKVGSPTITEIKNEMEAQLQFQENIHGAVPKQDSEGNPTFPWS